jgi:hypothetical protein
MNRLHAGFIHALTAGTDVRMLIPGTIVAGISAALVYLAGVVWWKRSVAETNRGRKTEARTPVRVGG